MSQDMTQDSNRPAAKGLKPWSTPTVRKIDLSEDEIARLKASDDPKATLLKMTSKDAKPNE